jgi:hypothetical protein
MTKPVTIPKTPQERHSERLRDMEREFEVIQKTLNSLSDVIDSDWVSQKFRNDDDLSDLAGRIEALNTALMFYIRGLQKDPNRLPDNRGGDLEELKLCFDGIRFTVKRLEKLLPPDSHVPDGFVDRLGIAPEDVVLKQPNPTNDGSVAIDAPDEQQGSVPKKKKSHRYGDDYILPGVYESEIRATIDALHHYAELAAPLVGVKLVQPYISKEHRPDQKVTELREFSIERRPLENPVDYGVPEGWTKTLNFRLSLGKEASTLRQK